MIVERDLEERAALVLGSLQAFASLLECQVRGLSVPGEELAPMARLLAIEAEKVLPIERASLHGPARNDR